jgi:hypothetical protein
MKRMMMAMIMWAASAAVFADGYYGYGYYGSPADAWANQQIQQIDRQERAAVMHEMREGDSWGAERRIRQAEAMKNEVRREEAQYDAYQQYARSGNYYGYRGW